MNALPNPYEPPRVRAVPRIGDVTADDDHPLVATFFIDRRLLIRAVHCDVQRHSWLRGAILFLSLLTMAALTVLLVSQQPLHWALTMVFVLVVLFVLQELVPYWWTRRVVRQYTENGKWPLTYGENRVRITAGALEVSAGDRTRDWPLSDVDDASYLFDALLICPEPGVVVPIPRTADFGADNFDRFCLTFFLRLRGLRES